MEQLSARIEALERSNRRLASVLVLLATIGVLLALIGWQEAQDPGRIVAREVAVVDENGDEKLVLGSDADGGQISLRNADGEEVVSVLVTPEKNGRMMVRNGSGKLQVILDCDPVGGVVAVQDLTGTTMATLETAANGGLITVNNAASQRVLELSADSSLAGYAQIWDSLGITTARSPED